MTQDDWKVKLDRELQRKKDQAAKENARKWELERRQVELDHQKMLKKHFADFPCHIRGCPNHSLGPNRYIEEREFGDGESKTVADYLQWDVPTGLFTCGECGELTCEAHFHRETQLCMECAKKKYNL